MSIEIVGPEVGRYLDWNRLTEALEAGHGRPKAQVADTLIYRGRDAMLTRSAWIDGMGLAVKAATLFPGNRSAGKPTIHGAVNLLSDQDGHLEAMIDFTLVTKWKTAGALGGYITLEEADQVILKDLENRTLCGFLTGNTKDKGCTRVTMRFEATSSILEISMCCEARAATCGLCVTDST